jgi:hypothetical protein
MFRYSFLKVLSQKKMIPNKSTSGWSISRILSSAEALVQSSLWAVRHRAARCSLPEAGSTHRREERMRRRAVSHRPQTISPLLGLAPGGGYLAICITADAGGLLHHLFTITLHLKVEGLFVSVALFRQVCAFRRLPRPGCYPTPCSMECGLSSIPTTQDRDCPTSLSCLHHTRWESESQPLKLLKTGIATVLWQLPCKRLEIWTKDIKIEQLFIS